MYRTYFIQMIKLTRAHIGIAVFPSFFLGSLFALILGYPFQPLVFLIGFVIIFLLYAAASYANDYYDFEADKYNQQFGFSGGSGVLQKYPRLKKITKLSALSMLILSLVLTIFLVSTSFLPFWAIGYIGIGVFFTWFYSAPPIRLVYRGFSEIPHFIAGIMNVGWGYILITGGLDVLILIFAIPFGLYLLNIILIFEIPDVEADVHGGKTNIIVQKGRRTGFAIISTIFWIAAIYFLALNIVNWLNDLINLYPIVILSIIPAIYSTYICIKEKLEKEEATHYAIHTAISLIGVLNLIILYFIFLLII